MLNGSASFNLYRGEVGGLSRGGYGDCLESAVPDCGTRDFEIPPEGAAWCYCVVGENEIGEGAMGRTFFGRPRSNPFPCP